MADSNHELNILVKAKGALQAARDIGKVDKSVSHLGATAQQGARNVIKNTALLGAGLAVGLGAAVKSGIDDLATLEDSITSVNGAIRTVGKGWKTTGADIAATANDIEHDIGAAFDDKDITKATAGLIRFGKVSESSLEKAMMVMTDLAVKTGSLESASSLLGKALADPTKAAGKLARVGIILTKEQQKQIKAMVKAGNVAGAQALLLQELEKTTKGAAAASQGPYRRALSVLADVSEDAKKALAEGFLPVLEKVADLLSKELAKPQTIKNIREFGKGLASGLDNLISIAQNLPWDAIGTSLKIGGAGAQAVLKAFTSLPPWVQTAVATGWGLNKLSGGALGSIVGELGKGLIKGVLGMNAGVVNINAGVVNGGGGVPGGAASGGGMGGLTKAAVGVTILGGVALSAESINELATKNAQMADQGLSAAEIAAVRYYQASTADQSFMAKRLGMVPSKSDYNAGIAKLQHATSGSLSKVNASIDHDRAATVAAIHRKKLSVKVSQSSKTTVKVAVTAAGVKQSITHLQRATKSGGTYTSGGYD